METEIRTREFRRQKLFIAHTPMEPWPMVCGDKKWMLLVVVVGSAWVLVAR